MNGLLPLPSSSPMRLLRSGLLPVLVLAVGLAACSSDGVEPAQVESGDITDVTHVLEPTSQMKQAAEQQCLDDPDLDVGYVKAVAPETGNVLAELEVDCSEVR